MRLKNVMVALTGILAVLWTGTLRAEQDASKPWITPGVLISRDTPPKRRVFIHLPGGFPQNFEIRISHHGGRTVKTLHITRNRPMVYLDIPCGTAGSVLDVALIGVDGRTLHRERVTAAPVRPWKVYLVPFTHIDIGFTQSQRKVLAQNVKNITLELDLIEHTRAFPAGTRFKLFTEVSWALDEYLGDPTILEANKKRLLNAVRRGFIEPGAFYISHQNKFMTPEAILTSMEPALRITDRCGVRLRTACIHDVMDFSGVVRPLHAAGVRYLMVGPNDSRYIVPPLFYLMGPSGSEKILVWHTTGLNGYGENFDLKMRLPQPFDESAFTEMEELLSRHLGGLETGYPTEELLKYYTYYGARWDYSLDAFLLPFYPTRGGDNQPQNDTPSVMARQWNRKWQSPRMIVATPAEFFEYAERRYGPRLPVLRGEMAGFWGEQIYLAMAQVDPRKTALQWAFDLNAFNSGAALVQRFLQEEASFNPSPLLWQGYRPLILNNDHNPRPVPFGKTNYDKRDVEEWMATRKGWINVMAAVGKWVYDKAVTDDTLDAPAGNAGDERVRVYREKGAVILENRYYRVAVDKRTGGIRSLFDRELNRELISGGGSEGGNRYFVAVRGENAGQRNRVRSEKGFRSVRVSAGPAKKNAAMIRIKGPMNRSVEGSALIARFGKEAFGINIPSCVIRLLTGLMRYIYPPLELTQEIILLPGVKRVEFVQRFSGRLPGMTEHLFHYPLGKSGQTTLLYDSAYGLLSFTPGGPLGNGDIIPAAKNTAPYRSINDSLYPFQWIYGMPPDFTFNTYVLVRGEGCAVAFASRESKLIVPGSLGFDPEKAPGGTGFYHCTLGWTLWGKLGLGAVMGDETVFHSAITSFDGGDEAYARAAAFDFGRRYGGYSEIRDIETGNASVRVVSCRPDGGNRLVLRVWETSGREVKTRLRFKTERKPLRAWTARSDGKALAAVPVGPDGLTMMMGPGELKTLCVEFTGIR